MTPWVALPPLPDSLRRAAGTQHPRRLNELSGMLSYLQTFPTLRDAARFEQTLLPLAMLATEKIRAQRPAAPELAWMNELQRTVREASRQASQRLNLVNRLAQRSAELGEMDFEFLFDKARDLFSIGFNATDHRMDSSFYDLLASEARLTSYLAISQYQVKQDHWFALGRIVVSPRGSPALVSWSGSMFEYLMPLLVMPTYENTLLDNTYKAAVERQIAYGKECNIPWGFSESGFNLTDAHLNYQYRAFGVPGLGLKRGLSDDLVVAPYATVMALMVAPAAACANLERLAQEGREGPYGFYEAIDYTPARLRPGQISAVVRSFMAHHQGMSLCSLAYLLLDRPMQRRFEANPLFKSADLLLQERVPKAISPLYPAELEVGGRPEVEQERKETLRVFTNPNAPLPEVHLLSNGRYHVMVSSSGGSYSSWKDVSLTRWREDATRDCWGAFCYLRDVESGEVWSAAYQPTCRVSRLYEAIFTQGRAEFRRRTDELDIHTEISVSPQDDIELRRLTIANRSSRPRTIEVTTYTEVALNEQGPDMAHPAFSKLFVQTEILPEQKALLCTRRPRSEKEKPPWFFHFVLPPVHEVGEVSFETDRSKFLGRGRSASAPAALDAPGPLSNSQGSVLDPVMAIRRTIKLAPDESIRIDSIYGAHENREGVLNLLQKYRDSALAGRVLELAWTHSQVILHHLNASETDAQTFGRLASSIVYAHRFRRAGSRILQKNNRSQNNLWAYGIPGDLPMALVLLTDVANIEFARKVVQAHAYWRMKGLTCDMVILTQDDSIYRQGLYEQVVGLVASSTEAQWLDKPGGIFVRHMEAIPEDDRILLQTVARLILSDEEGTLAEQADRRPRPDPVIPQLIPSRMPEADKSAPAAPASPALQFNNGYGGFSADGKEYVITLNAGQVTPAPWVNVLANPSFGSVISESGSSYTWAENAHEFRLTPWYNDPVSDTTGEAFYIRDEQTGQFWSPCPGPVRGEQPYTVRHGFGYSVFSHRENEIESELTVFVARDVPLKFAWLKVRNLSTRVRRLSAIGYWEWVLGELRDKNLMHVITEVDPRSGALLARNPYNGDFSGRVAFADVQIATRQFTTDRGEFLGRNGSLANPAALHRLRLSGKVGGGWDPCAALQVIFDLGEGQERDVVFRIGVGRDGGEAQHLIQHFRGVDAARKSLDAVKQYWNRTVDAVQVETPEPAVDLLANGWLIYQVLASRMWARSGFYQSGGAFGFRDQLQDAMGLLHCESRLLREHLLRAAGHQFVEGDVQHWWHPPTDRGVRTHFSDDYLWLPYATCRYVLGLNDTGILDEMIPFLEGRPVKPEEEAYFDLPRRSGASGTLYEHCVRAINHGLRTGAHGLPLMGCGDWNDGMNLVGEHGKGESVWLAFFLYDVLTQFAEVARLRKDESFAQHCLSHAAQLRQSIEQAWDGGWYRRAYFDDGTPLGSATNDECQIDSLPQSWSVISRAGDPERARQGMDAADQHLVKRDSKVIQLFEPPFDKSALNPGYIKGYVPGVRENGGQYTHAAIWMIMAFAMMGDHKRAWELVTMIVPQNHSRDLAGADVYKVEPYVAVADVYAVWPHMGRGGWTWYTGSAGWLYRLILEHLLGVKLEVDHLRFVPCLPPSWKSFVVRYRYRDTVYHIAFSSQSAWLKVQQVLVDGEVQPGETLPLVDDLKEHHAEVRFL
ncbi:MAG TPA: glucoamylase family protein [Candidatus Saccharimonadales bacterium]|nr:glucoamylase family protein [Candidatus Saccharimonadales bacterium]